MIDRFTVCSTEDLVLERVMPLSDYYVLSPYVWREKNGYHLLVRAVNRSKIASEKVASIYHGAGQTPIDFTMDREPAIAPGPEKFDKDGCEDPTVVLVDDTYYIYYSGWNQDEQKGELLYATGRHIDRLEKRGPVFSESARNLNMKEATLVCAADQRWRMFFEFAQDDKSKIGIATGAPPDGPWEVGAPPFDARPGSWDSWHLSPGPVSMLDHSRPIMFYNGADRDAHWRIGWVEFDPSFSKVLARGSDPLITPPPREQPDDTDIAFVASALDDPDNVALYYSVADRRLMRSMLERS